MAFRVRQLGNAPFSRGGAQDYQELDRAFLAWHTGPFNLCLGRQAIGWGRGQVFSAVDLFAPFSPTQIDREWRRGVDAADLDFELTDASSLGLVLAGGPDWGRSALGARLRGYLGPLDASLLLAKRAEDRMAGLAGSMALGGAEVHAEAALFNTPGDVPDNGMFGDPDLVPKLVLGASNNFPVGAGLQATLEYHYSGFAAPTAADLPAWLSNPDLQARFQRGDSQILLRQAAALVLGTTFSQAFSGGLQVLQSLVDPSGLAGPSLEWDESDSLSFSLDAFVGWGKGLKDGLPRSQFGATPATLLVEARWYG